MHHHKVILLPNRIMIRSKHKHEKVILGHGLHKNRFSEHRPTMKNHHQKQNKVLSVTPSKKLLNLKL
jgi:hypothetical protein